MENKHKFTVKPGDIFTYVSPYRDYEKITYVMIIAVKNPRVYFIKIPSDPEKVQYLTIGSYDDHDDRFIERCNNYFNNPIYFERL